MILTICGYSAKVCRNNMFIMSIMAVIAVFLARPVVLFLWGPEYEQVTYVLYSILWGIVIYPFYRFLVEYFASEKKLEIGIFAAFIGIVSNVVANIYLIPRYGIVGAGVASSISYTMLSLILLIFFHHYTKIRVRDVLIPNGEDFRMYARRMGDLKDRLKRLRGGSR